MFAWREGALSDLSGEDALYEYQQSKHDEWKCGLSCWQIHSSVYICRPPEKGQQLSTNGRTWGESCWSENLWWPQWRGAWPFRAKGSDTSERVSRHVTLVALCVFSQAQLVWSSSSLASTTAAATTAAAAATWGRVTGPSRLRLHEGTISVIVGCP